MIEWLKGKENHVLCYIKDGTAYFTSLPLNEQTGDDWDDVPYEHNAGEPYYQESDQIIKIAYISNYSIETPSERAGSNSSYSVDMINSKAVAWLTGYDYELKEYVTILAGSSIEEFITKIIILEGEIFLPLNKEEL